MKKIIGLVIIIVALVLASYYGMGYLTERTLKKDFARINQNNGMSVDVKYYQRALFSANAMLHVHLHIPERSVTNASGETTMLDAEDYDLDIPLTIYHGPIIFADSNIRFGFGYAVTDISLPPNLTEKFNNLFTNDSNKPQLHFALFVNYFNDTYLDVNIPKFTLNAKQGNNHVEWLGLLSQVKLSPNLVDVDGNINLTGINVSKEQNKISLGKISSKYDLHMDTIGLYIGTADFDLQSMQIFSGNVKLLEIDNFQLKSSSDIKDNLFNSSANLSLTKYMNDGYEYGPGYFDIAVKNIDAKTLVDLNQKLNTMQQSAPDWQQGLFLVFSELPKLFAHGTELEIKRLNLIMPEGELSGNLLLNVPANKANNPFQVIQSLQGTAHLQIPTEIVKNLISIMVKHNLQASVNLQQAMIQQLQKTQNKSNSTVNSNVDTIGLEQMVASQTNQKLQALQESGLLVLKDNYYIIDINLKDGQFIINGKPFDASMFPF